MSPDAARAAKAGTRMAQGRRLLSKLVEAIMRNVARFSFHF